jgi:hypothetical protein
MQKALEPSIGSPYESIMIKIKGLGECTNGKVMQFRCDSCRRETQPGSNNTKRNLRAPYA